MGRGHLHGNRNGEDDQRDEQPEIEGELLGEAGSDHVDLGKVGVGAVEAKTEQEEGDDGNKKGRAGGVEHVAAVTVDIRLGNAGGKDCIIGDGGLLIAEERAAGDGADRHAEGNAHAHGYAEKRYADRAAGGP